MVLTEKFICHIIFITFKVNVKVKYAKISFLTNKAGNMCMYLFHKILTGKSIILVIFGVILRSKGQFQGRKYII